MDYRQEILDIHSEVSKIMDAADQEHRDVDDVEDARLRDLFARFEQAERKLKIENMETAVSQTQKSTQSQGRKAGPQPIYTGPSMASQQNDVMPTAPGSLRLKNAQTGEPIRTYRYNEPLCKTQLPDGYGIGDVVAGIARNDVDGLPGNLRNAVTIGSDTSGGTLFSPTLSTILIDLARSRSVTMAAGAQTMTLMGETHVARLTGDVSTYWRPETGSITASQTTFGKLVLKPKVIAALVPISYEWLEDVSNGPQIIENAISAAMGLAIDQACLTGTGAAAEPRGILNDPDTASQTSVGTPSTYADVRTAISSILANNYPGMISDLSWILHPSVAAVYDGLVTGISSDNTPLPKSDWVDQLQTFYTTTLDISNSPQTGFDMVIGDISQLLVGMTPGGIRVQVLDAGTATDTDSTSWNAVTQLMRFVRVYARIDCALIQPTWVCHLSGVTTS